MKNLFKKLFLFSLLLGTIVSCDHIGADNALDYGTGPFVTQFPYAEKTAFFLKTPATVFPYDIPVELVGGNGLPLASNIDLAYEVDLVNSTAIEGTHFSFASPSTNLVIPAGSTFASIKINVNSGSLDDANPPVLILKLKSVSASGANIVNSGNKATISLILQGFCTSALAGNYSLVSTRISPAGGPYTAALDVIDEVSAGTYNTTFTGGFYSPGGGTPGTGSWSALAAGYDAGYTFKEVCGRIKLETQNLAGVYSNEVRQSAAQYAASNVNAVTGVITVYYSIFFSGNTVERTYSSVYTPI